MLVNAALASAIVASSSAYAQGKLDAHYASLMAGIPIGQSVWSVDIGHDVYTTSASGGASGIFSLLVRGEGTLTTRGKIKNGKLEPTSFASDVTEDGEKIALRMALDDGVVTELNDDAAPAGSDRVPVAEAHRRGVIDPLTAMLVPVGGTGDVPAADSCNRTLPIFDGRRRYDLVLSFKRVDKIEVDKGHAGPALVCGVVLQPIAGHRSRSMIMQYVAGRRDMEIWFAPISGTRIMAPFRVSVPTLVGTMAIQADQFYSAARAP